MNNKFLTLDADAGLEKSQYIYPKTEQGKIGKWDSILKSVNTRKFESQERCL